jgi:hypothetical protein
MPKKPRKGRICVKNHGSAFEEAEKSSRESCTGCFAEEVTEVSIAAAEQTRNADVRSRKFCGS